MKIDALLNDEPEEPKNSRPVQLRLFMTIYYGGIARFTDALYCRCSVSEFRLR